MEKIWLSSCQEERGWGQQKVWTLRMRIFVATRDNWVFTQSRIFKFCNQNVIRFLWPSMYLSRYYQHVCADFICWWENWLGLIPLNYNITWSTLTERLRQVFCSVSIWKIFTISGWSQTPPGVDASQEKHLRTNSSYLFNPRPPPRGQHVSYQLNMRDGGM